MSNITITADLVKQLRVRTDAPMMDCKRALVDSNGDLEAAEDILRASGAKKAAKAVDRVAAQGVSMAVVSDSKAKGIILEVNCETDFVAKDENFKYFVMRVSQILAEKDCSSIEDLLKAMYSDSQTVEQARGSLIAKVGENIQIRRFECVSAPAGGIITSYTHGDRIAVLIALSQPLETLAKDLAMQVAAMRPLYVEASEVPEAMMIREKAILVERSKESGNSSKAPELLEKIIQGQLKKYLNELCLVGQAFIKNPDETVEVLLKKNQAKVTRMVRFEVGEGIEVEKKNFLEEVMEQVNKL